MSVESVLPDMNDEIWEFISPIARNNSWTVHDRGQLRLEKDGYEIYIHETGGYELTIRDPETQERRAVFERRGIDFHSPLHVAILIYIIQNPEEVVNECV